MDKLSWILGAALAGGVIFAASGCTTPSTADYPRLQTAPVNPAVLQARFFGVSTIVLSDGTDQIMVDGFFSRPGLGQMIFSALKPKDGRIDDALEWGHITTLRAVVVAHAHHDHALDSATVVRRMQGSTLYGSPSVRTLALSQGLADQRITVVGNRETKEMGEFLVTFFETPHSARSPWWRPDFRHNIERPVGPHPHVWKFGAGENFSFLFTHKKGNVLVVPSAGPVGCVFEGVHADVVFLGIGTLGNFDRAYITQYWNDVVKTVGAKWVIPVHWDDFSHPLNAAGTLQALPRPFDDMRKAMEILQDLAEGQVKIRLMPLYQTVNLEP